MCTAHENRAWMYSRSPDYHHAWPAGGFRSIHDYIIIGDNVTISAGVRIIGNLTIGSNTWIGPNTIVTNRCRRFHRARQIDSPTHRLIPMTLRNTLRLITADTRERARLEQKHFGFASFLKLFLNPPALAVVIYRFQHWLCTSGWPALPNCCGG